MRYLIFALAILLGPALSARAQVSVNIGVPGVNIGINMPVYPQLVLIPGYPVYYDPAVNSNYFFYDGLYWIYSGDSWYSSTWYNGPWDLVPPEYVPQFVLLVPVRYYRSPPVYFRGWAGDAPPRWGDHWGRSWEQQRSGWDRWDRRSEPAAAPLPIYQRQYSGDRYPRAIAQQQALRTQNYRYQPRDALAKRSFQQATQGQPQGQPQAQAKGTTGLRTQTQQKPVQQGAVPQTEQLRLQGQQQQQQGTQAQTTRQVRPAQSAAQIQGQGGQHGPQEKAHVEKGSLQGKGPETKSAPKEMKAASQPSGPQGGGQNRAGPPNRGAENKGGPQESKGEPQGNKGNEKGARGGNVKGDENKKE